MLFDLQPITPTIVKVVPAPAREIGVLDVLIGALGLTGVIVLGSVVLGCVLGAIIIGFKRWRAERTGVDGSSEQIRLDLSAPPR